MSVALDAALGVAAVGGMLAVGSLALAFADEAAAAAVAGAPLRPRRLLVAPFRRAASALLTATTTTERPDGGGRALAPALLAGLAALAMSMLPLAPGVVPADPSTGFVVFSAAVAFVMIAVFLHGWSPNSTLPLHGAYRFGAVALSFQIPFLLAMLATALPAQSLSLVRIVEAQAPLWNVIREPLGLPIYLIVGLAVGLWGPLNLPDADDLAGGTSAEDSGLARWLWEAARTSMLVAVAALGSAAFLGGYLGPLLPGPVWVALKTALLLAVMAVARHALARARIERFVEVAWVLLVPLALLNVFVSGAFLL